MLVSRNLATIAAATSLLVGTLGAALAPPAASPVQPAESGSVGMSAYYDSGTNDAVPVASAGEASPVEAADTAAPVERAAVADERPYSDADGSRFVAILPGNDTNVPDFGSPPSGEVPILFNDRHVYSKPDRLSRGRLLAALVRNGTILVPLRALFEQLGATVSYDPSTKTTSAHRAGTEIALVVGKNVAVIDGVTRPLDVPPMQIGDTILVPVRVIAEVFGAYVQWLPDKRAVTVRYLSSTAIAPAPAETPVPLAIATTLPTPRPRRTVGPGPALPKRLPSNETFIAIDPIVSPMVANEFAPNVTGASGLSFVLRGADEFSLLGGAFEIDARYTKNRYPHPDGFVTIIGANEHHFVPALVENDYELSANFGIQLSPEKFYLDASYATFTGNVGYPRLGGVGFGLNKLPVLDRKISYEGALFYYPNLSGNCTTACPSGPYRLTYKLLRYDAGLTALLGHKVFIEAGYQGDKGIGKAFAPTSFTHAGPFGGLGVRF